VNEVESSAIAILEEKLLDLFGRNFCVERLHASKRKDGVVKIGPALAILSATFGRELAAEEIADQLSGITQQPGREAGDLKELQPKTQVQKQCD
jgi:hypothetical protein